MNKPTTIYVYGTEKKISEYSRLTERLKYFFSFQNKILQMNRIYNSVYFRNPVIKINLNLKFIKGYRKIPKLINIFNQCLNAGKIYKRIYEFIVPQKEKI